MKKKLFIFGLLLGLPVVLFAAIQIWWFSQAPHATSVNDTDIMLVERPVPHTNLWFNMAQLKSYTSTGITNLTVSNAYVTVLYSLTNFIDYITVTNGITNLSLTPNTVLKADGGQQIASIPNGTGALTNDGAGNFGWTAVVGSSGPWTNNSDFIWPAGEPAPDTTGATPGPGFFLRYDGSKFVGTNVTADVVVTTANTVYDYTVSMLASNDPPSAKFFNYGINNENYDYFAGFTLFRFVDANNPLSTFQLESQTTGGTWHSFKVTSDPGGSTSGLLLQTNNPGSIFKVDNNGLTTANGYIDESGNIGDLVAYGPSKRLVATNVLSLLTNVAVGSQVLTNDGFYVHLSGTRTNVNAPWSIANDGEFFIGTNVFAGALAPGFHVFGTVSFTDSNQPAFQYYDSVVTDNTQRKNYGIVNGAATISSASWTLFSGTAGASTNTVALASQTSHAPFTFQVDSTNRVILPYTGIWDSQGYVDESGIDGQFVSYASGKRLTPTLNGGALTNVNNVSTGLSNYITSITNGMTPLPANAAGALTNSGAGVLGWYGSYATQPSANAFAGSNYFGSTVTTSTNLTFGPDFSVEESLVSTNAAFTFTAPVGVDTAGKTVQWTLVNVTNTTAAAVLITSPANCHTVGINYVTNWTAVWFQVYAQKITNAYYIPVF